MAGVQDDSSGAKTMAARAASDRAASRLKATCNGLALFDQREQGEAEGTWGFDGDGRWPARHFSSDSPSLAVDIIRRQIA
jgi:hypothetical protein